MTPILVPSGVDEGQVWHTGNPVADQRALESGTAFVRLTNRPVFTVTGADRLTWLNSLSSQLIDGSATDAYILSPQGRIEHYFAGFDDGDTFFGFTEPGRLTALLDFLRSMRFRLDVEVAENVQHHVVYAAGANHIEPNRLGRHGVEVGMWALEAHRIASGLPRTFLDTDERTIPNELFVPTGDRLGPAVHLKKGCYRGQETVARVWNVGRPPRRLTLLHLDGSMNRLPQLGAPVQLGELTVGRMGTSVLHHELGPIGLALVKRTTDLAADLQVDGIAAAQEPIVSADVGLHVRLTRD